MRLGKDLENKPIISVSDGQILGRTRDIYADKDLENLAGLYVGTEGVIRRKERVIPNDRIILFGVDVILVKDPDVITTTSAYPETTKWHRLSHLHGKQVQTPGGTKLATIDDAVLDEQGAITGFTLSRVFVTGPLAESPFIPREVVVDAFQSGDMLLVDLPRFEEQFAKPEPEPEEEAPAEEESIDIGDAEPESAPEPETDQKTEEE
jgi:uncharacterized protein YrrD